MPALRSNKQTPTNITSDGANHPLRRSARLMEKGPRVPLVDIPRCRGAGKAKDNANAIKVEPSASPGSVSTPARPLLRVNTDAAGLANVNGSVRQLSVGCFALRTPCVVCFPQDQLLTPLHPETLFYHLPQQQTPRTSTLRPAVWSSTASEFSLPPTPALEYCANFYDTNAVTRPRPRADPTRLHGLQNMYHHTDVFTAFAVPGQDFDPFHLVTTSGLQPTFTHIVRILEHERHVPNGVEGSERYGHPLPRDPDMYWQRTYKDITREIKVLTLVVRGHKLGAGQLEAARKFMCDHLPESPTRGNEPRFYTPGLLHESTTAGVLPEEGRARVLILAPIDSIPVPLVASPTEGSAGLTYPRSHIFPPESSWQQSWSQAINAFTVALLSLRWNRQRDCESLREALRTHMYMVKSGSALTRSELDSDNREKALVSAVPFELLAKVLNDADDAMGEGQDDCH